MADNGVGRFPVYTGVWTNWSRSPILGATLTLTKSEAHLLIAFAAVFTAIVGTRLWRIICLGIHFSLSSDKPQDALHHQRQAILRNAADPEAGFVALSNLAWSWKGRGTKAATRLGGLIVLSVAWFFGFVFLGGFSSLIANATGEEVLLVGDKCSVKAIEVPSDLTQGDLDQIKSFEASRVMEVANTIRKCSELGTDDQGDWRCNSFAVNGMPLAIRNITAGCPFDADVCESIDGNILLDTGLIDSHQHLGINSPTTQRFGYRRRLHCAPLKTEGYQQDLSVPGERRTTTQYFYGRQWDAAREEVFTYEHENHLSNTTRADTPIDYTIGVRSARRRNGSLLEDESSVDPIPDLLLEDADLILFFLSANDITFPRQSRDPWYRITARNPATDAASRNATNPTVPATQNFVQAEAASPMACAVREQYCNPNKDLLDPTRCGPFGSPTDAIEGAIESRVFEDMPEMRTVLNWAIREGWNSGSDMGEIVKTLGSQALGARNLLSDGVGSLADNQWQLDVESWHQTAMLSIQESLVQSVAGPPNAGVARLYSQRPQADEEFQLCQSQIIRSPRHQSFSVLGLSLLFGVGVLIYVLSYALDHLLGCMAGRLGIKKYQYQEWCSGEVLHLQRLAHEEAGESFWAYSKGATKLTSMLDVDKGPAVASLDMTDPRRPWLKRQSRYTWDPNTGTFSLRTDFPRQERILRRWSPET